MNAVDQGLDRIEIALAVEGAEADLARFGTLAGFGQLHAWHLPQQFPAVGHVLVLDLVGAQDIHRCQHLMRTELAFGMLMDVDLAERQRRIGGLRACVGSEEQSGDSRHEGMDLHEASNTCGQVESCRK